jgi:hypothetical protein
MPKPVNISASRGSAILGLSNWSTPTEVWLKIMEEREPGFCKKHNYEYPIFEETAQIRWGKAFESSIIELAERKQGIDITDRERLYSAGALFPFITCHIDGKYSKKILHEGKTTAIFYYRENFGEPGTDKVPVDYQIQTQHQMICTGAEKVILSVLVFPRRVDDWEEMGWEFVENEKGYFLKNDIFTEKTGLDGPIKWARILNKMGYFHQYEINANPKLQELMIMHYKEFWEENIIKGIPPKPKTYDDIRKLVRNPIGTIIATEEMERVVSEYRIIKDEISEKGPLGKRIDQIKIDILQFMKNADAVPDDDTRDKWILRDRAGKKIASYSKNKKGNMVFR